MRLNKIGEVVAAFLVHRFVRISVAILTVGMLILYIRAESYDITHVVLESQVDIIDIADASRKQLFYGTLVSVPHTYAFTLSEPTLFDARLFVAPGGIASTTISAILIKEPEKKGRVIEIARLRARESSWEMVDGGLVGGELLQGPQFTEELTPGNYRFEVHTPDNREPYLLTLGTHADRTMGYRAFMRELSAVTTFVGRSSLSLITSPHVFVPIYFVIIACYAAFLWRKRPKSV